MSDDRVLSAQLTQIKRVKAGEFWRIELDVSEEDNHKVARLMSEINKGFKIAFIPDKE